jgi:hypothetical protein
MHLSAAGLRLGEMHLMTESFEETDYSFARFGEKRVVVTGDKKVYAQPGSPAGTN